MSKATTNTLRRPDNGQPPQQPTAAIQPAARTGALAIIEQRRDVIAGLLAADKPADIERFMRSAAFAIARTPKLMQCTPNSLIECVCTGAELKLDFTPSLGLAYMVPYNVNIAPKGSPPKWESRSQFQVGYRGLIALALRSGRVRAIEAHCVYERDEFQHEMGTTPSIVHRRPKLGVDRGDLIGAYAIATMPDGTKQADVMDAMELQAIRDRSKSGDSGPWKTDPGEMSKKTVVKRLCKYLQLTPEVGTALEHDNEDTDLELIDEAPRQTNTQKLTARLGVAPEPEQTRDDSDAQEPGQDLTAPIASEKGYVEIGEGDIPF